MLFVRLKRQAPVLSGEKVAAATGRASPVGIGRVTVVKDGALAGAAAAAGAGAAGAGAGLAIFLAASSASGLY